MFVFKVHDAKIQQANDGLTDKALAKNRTSRNLNRFNVSISLKKKASVRAEAFFILEEIYF
jgi:hypothetical protein